MKKYPKTIALVVDMQKGLVKEHPFMETEVIEQIASTLLYCRTEGIEVVYVQHDDGEGEDLHPGSEAFEIIEELAPHMGERIFIKERNSSFYKTGLKEYLSKAGIEKIILMGMQTEYCIDATCKAAFEHGFSVFIPEGTNTTFDNDYLLAEKSISYYNQFIWDGRYALVRPFNEVQLMWWEFLTQEKKSFRTPLYDIFHFCYTKELANELLQLVLKGKKTATSSSQYAYESPEAQPQVGSYSIITDYDGAPRCVIETILVTHIPFNEMTFEICNREGEDTCLETWVDGHRRYFMQEAEECGYTFSEEMPVLFEDFRVVFRWEHE